MPMLPELQRTFSATVLNEQDTGLICRLRATRTAPEVAVEIYRNNVFSNLTDTLADVYSAVRTLVGADFFRAAAERYIHATPSVSGNLNDYGAGFAGFLATFPPAASLPYLPDVARLEWMMHEALLAPDAEIMDLAPLTEVAPDEYGRIRFQLHPAVRLMISSYPLFRIWRLCQDNGENADTVSLSEGGVYLLVSRPADKVEITALGAGEFALLSAIQQQHSFAEVCEQALQSDPELDVTAYLQRHVLERTVTGWQV